MEVPIHHQTERGNLILHTNDHIIKHKVGLQNLVEELGNVSRAYQVMMLLRDTFYRCKQEVEQGGVESLQNKDRHWLRSTPSNNGMIHPASQPDEMERTMRMQSENREVKVMSIDLAKSSFHGHSVDASGGKVVGKKLSRQKLKEYLINLPQCTVAMEACAGAHYWARQCQSYEPCLSGEHRLAISTVRVPILPPVLANGDIDCVLEDRRPRGITDLQVHIRKLAGECKSKLDPHDLC